MAAKGARLLSWLWERWSEGRDVDGDDIQGFLTKEGFVRRVPYDPARHGTDFEAAEFMEPGDDYFEPSEIGRTMLDAARIRKVPTSRDDDNG